MRKKAVYSLIFIVILNACNLVENEVIEGEDRIAEELIREVTHAIMSQNEKNK